MTRRKDFLTIFGASLAILLSLATIAATSAQATPTWTLVKKKLTGLALTLSVESLFKLLVKFIGLHLHWEKGHVHKVIHPEGRSTGTIKFTEGTVTDENGKLLKACSVQEVVTLEFESHLIEKEGSIYDVYGPFEKAGSFGTITIGGEECALATENEPLSGSFSALVASKEVVNQPLVVNEALSSLKYGTKPATLTGETTLSLKGEDEGKVWGATK